MSKTCQFTLPFVLKIDSILKKIYSKKLLRERFFILLLLIERKSKEHPNKNNQYNKARLMSKYIKKLIGLYYLDYINVLIKKGILNTDNHYIVGEKSKDYWITNNFKKSVNMDTLMINSFVEISDELYKKIREQRLPPTKPHLKQQYDLLCSDKFVFNTNAANEWLANEVKNGLDINSNKFNCYKRMIFDFDTKDIITVEDEKTGRIFTNFNLCKRELRKFCYIQEDEFDEQIYLDSVDLKSSQPYLLASMFLKQYPTNKDVKKFYDIIVNDDIYIYFLNKFIEINGSNEFYTNDTKIVLNNRNDIKPEFLKVLFKDNRGFALLEKVFKQEFPDVLKFIQVIKKEKNNELALTLQREESKIFITAYNELTKLNIDCLTVHDSLYFKEIYKDKVINILNKVFINNGYSNYKLV